MKNHSVTKERYRFGWFKYLGFFGFLGFTYFIEHRISALTGFLFFCFFNTYFVEKFSKLNPDSKLTARATEISIRTAVLPALLSLFLITKFYRSQLAVMIIAVAGIVATFMAATMIPYFYAKRVLKQKKTISKKL